MRDATVWHQLLCYPER